MWRRYRRGTARRPGHRHLARRRDATSASGATTGSSRTTPGTASAPRCTSRPTCPTTVDPAVGRSSVEGLALAVEPMVTLGSQRHRRSTTTMDGRDRATAAGPRTSSTPSRSPPNGPWVLTALDGGEASWPSSACRSAVTEPLDAPVPAPVDPGRRGCRRRRARRLPTRDRAERRRPAPRAAHGDRARQPRPRRLVRHHARRWRLQRQRPGVGQVRGPAPDRDRAQRAARRCRAPGLPVPRRLLRHRGARHPPARDRRPCAPGTGGAAVDLAHGRRQGRPAVRRSAPRLRGVRRAQGGPAPGCRRTPCCWPSRPPARCRRSGWAETSTRPSSTPSSTWPGSAPGSTSTGTPATSSRTRPKC